MGVLRYHSAHFFDGLPLTLIIRDYISPLPWYIGLLSKRISLYACFLSTYNISQLGQVSGFPVHLCTSAPICFLFAGNGVQTLSFLVTILMPTT